MNFNAPLLRPIRILLFPISLAYGATVWLRNRLYEKNLLQSTSFNLPIICIGNLSVGGTGKSTMVEYLAYMVKDVVPLAILSRGYKRKTTGYALANEKASALEIGDEPMQFHIKFPDVAVAVGEERIFAIPQLLHDRPDTKVILLDDAFQHRSVKAGLNILLTEYANLFTRDWFLPTGDLRDEVGSYRRAQIIVVTKCPESLEESKKKEIIEEIEPTGDQKIFFSSIKYGNPYHLLQKYRTTIRPNMEVLLVSGIANPLPLKEWLTDHCKAYYEMRFGDHHIFTIDDWQDIVKRFNSIETNDKIILTTEKDAVRLIKFEQEFKNLPLFVMPIEMHILFNEGHRFSEAIFQFINLYQSKINNE